MKYEYEAVSGNQDVFKHNESGKAHTATISSDGKLTFWITGYPKNDVVIAERKVKEVKLPVVGDNLIFSGFTSEYRYQVVAINEKSVSVLNLNGINEGHYDSFNISALDKCTIIDQSKQPNPVNMVEDKWVPSIGDKFKTDRLNGIYLCLGLCDRFVTAVNTESGIRQPFSISYNKFIKA